MQSRNTALSGLLGLIVQFFKTRAALAKATSLCSWPLEIKELTCYQSAKRTGVMPIGIQWRKKIQNQLFLIANRTIFYLNFLNHLGSLRIASAAVMSQPQVVSRHSPSNYRK